MGGHVGGNPPFPVLVADPFGKNFGLTKVVEDSPVLSEWVERIAQIHPEIDTLLNRFATFGQMREGFERLLESRDCHSVSRTCGSFLPGLTAVGGGLVPDLALEGMMSE